MARGLYAGTGVFLASSLLFLAYDDAGCIDDEGNLTSCDNTVFGFRPSSILTNISVITGLAAAVLNPFIGTIIDYTDYRHALGCGVSLGMVLIQGAQGYTVAATWFYMALLQAVVAFLKEVYLMSAYAYLPDIKDEVRCEMFCSAATFT